MTTRPTTDTPLPPELYRNLFEHANDGIFLVNSAGNITNANPRACEMTGYSHGELIALSLPDLIPPADFAANPPRLDELNTGHPLMVRRHLKRKDGSVFVAEISASKFSDGNAVGIVRDVTERHLAEERLTHLRRLYAMLSQANSSIVRISSSEELCNAICRTTVEQGEFRMAWIGLIDKETGRTVPTVVYGHDQGFVSSVVQSDASALCPIGEAIREGTLVTCNNMATDPRMVSCRKAALARGYGSSAVVPFRLRGTVAGTLNLYAGEPAFFGEAEMKLLEEIGRNLSFALDTLAAEEERRYTMEALLAAEERFRSLVEQIPAVVYLADARSNSSTHYVSPLIHSMLGYTQEEWMADPNLWARSLHPEDSERVEREFTESAHAKTTFVSEYRIRRRDGVYIWMRDEARILPNPRGEAYVQGVMLDISAQRLAAEALRESEERFRTTLYSIGDGVITTDIWGSIRQMNPAAETLTGWTEAEAQGQFINTVFRVIHESTDQPLDDPVSRVMKDGTVVGLASDAVLIARKGTRRRIADSGAPIRNSTGETTGVVLVFNDQTERKSLEAQLLQSQKLEAIGRLAGGIAHDFNNMIGIILGYADLLAGSLKESHPDLLRNAEAIVSASNRAAALTRQLLAFARKQVAAPVPMNVNDVLLSLQHLFTRLIGEDITLSFVPAPGLWQVKMDQSQLEQVLTNLITNARDAIANVGAITLETFNVVADENFREEHVDSSAGEYVLLRVSDNGAGMDAETQLRMFEPFFTTKPKGEGTGLGLSTVFGIVKQNGGFIAVDSKLDRGTTISIYLPRYVGTESAPAQSAQPDGSTRGSETILLVEDEVQLLDLTKEGLEMHGYTVLAASDPTEALRLCEKHLHEIDLLITDVVMPGMNGQQLAERILALRPDIKTVFVSGYTANIVARRGILEEGMNFVPKPYTPRTLLTKVRQVLDERP